MIPSNRRIAAVRNGTNFILAVLLIFAILAPLALSVSAKDSWTGVRSKSFQLVGNASEKEIKQVALRLEQFREVFSRLFPRMNLTSPVPTTVIVFKNDSSYRPFKSNPNMAGYFQSGQDVNYITLTTEAHGEQDPFNVIFHEYTHLLVNNTVGNVPVWFNEGLAECYSTFNIKNDQDFVLGTPIASHVFLLRDSKMLPLRTLFEVDQHSPYYNERDKQSVFYAESWALMHYIILGNQGKRLPQLNKFINLVTSNKPMEQAFQEAFQVSFEVMEKELREYIKHDTYPIRSVHFESRLLIDKEMEVTPLTEAEASAYLGDLLLHINRAESETYLQKALALDPNLAMANASLGMKRIRQGQSAEARKYLERALAANAQNYLINYYHAYVLSREGERLDQRVMGYPEETAQQMRADLRKAIDLRPDFPESYKLLAFINLVTDTQLDESITLLKRVLATSPGRGDLLFVLAQLYLRKEDFKTARGLLENLSKGNSDVRSQSQSMLSELTTREEQWARFRAAQESADSTSGGDTAKLIRRNPSDPNAVAVNDPYAPLREALRKPGVGEQQIEGTLLRIDCDPKTGITFVIKVAERIMKLRTDRFETVRITSFTRDVAGELTCGPRKPENQVVMCYLPLNGPGAKADGNAKSIDFVPREFQLQLPPVTGKAPE